MYSNIIMLFTVH